MKRNICMAKEGEKNYNETEKRNKNNFLALRADFKDVPAYKIKWKQSGKGAKEG